MQNYKEHELSKIIPSMTDEEYNNLKKDIKENGFNARFPIIIFKDQILDGRHRYKACKELNVEPKFEAYEGISPASFVISANVSRRNLTASQLAVVAEEFLPELEVEAKNRQREHGETAPGKKKSLMTGVSQVIHKGKSREQASKLLGVGTTYIQDVKAIRKREPKLIQDIKDKKITISEIKKQFKTEDKQKDIAQQRKDIASGKIKLPEGKFEVIAIDPPWPYGGKYDASSRRVSSPYPEMQIEDLKKINLPASDDCVLWLWTTHKFIFDAKDLMDKWGFDYKGILTWDKQDLGMGSWLRMQCEFCLLGIKGKPTWNLKNERDMLSEKRREHSRKPASFYKMVDSLCIGRKLDYFSREKHEGWEQLGNTPEKLGEK